MVAPRSISACAKSPARWGQEALDEPPNLGLARGQFLLEREDPRDHPLDVAVDRRGRHVERDRRDRCRRIGADAGQRGKRRCVLWKASAVALDHRLGAGVEMSRARVIAEPGPQAQHLLETRGGKCMHARPPRDEARKIRRDRLHGGLLQHDFGEPHAIRVALLARCRAPGQRAAMAVIPGQQIGAARMHRPRRVLSPFHVSCYRHGRSMWQSLAA
jgi:hypothetical protein